MGVLRLLPQFNLPPIEPRGMTSRSWPNSLSIGSKHALQRYRVTLQGMKSWTWLPFLPSGQAISMEVVGYANPALLKLGGREQGIGRACTLLTRQSSIQVLLSIDSIPSASHKEDGDL